MSSLSNVWSNLKKFGQLFQMFDQLFQMFGQLFQMSFDRGGLRDLYQGGKIDMLGGKIELPGSKLARWAGIKKS